MEGGRGERLRGNVIAQQTVVEIALLVKRRLVCVRVCEGVGVGCRCVSCVSDGVCVQMCKGVLSKGCERCVE